MQKERYDWIIAALVALVLAAAAQATPSGPTVTSNTTYNASLTSALMINTSGGSFTEMVLNASSQNFRWKAYVGNVTGTLTLQDPTNYSIYNWNLSTVSGEVYVTRNSSVNWGNINCTNDTIITAEQTALNITSSRPDSINGTFFNTIHRSIYVGQVQVRNSSCRSIVTYANGTSQVQTENAPFQEVLLMDRTNLVYVTPLEGRIQGFNFRRYDFQIIVPDYGTDQISGSVGYYFYVELS